MRLKAIELNPDSGGSYVNWEATLLNKSDMEKDINIKIKFLEKSIEKFKKAIELNPNKELFQNNLKIAENKLKRIKDKK